jgi:hypothetical protein
MTLGLFVWTFDGVTKAIFLGIIVFLLVTIAASHLIEAIEERIGRLSKWYHRKFDRK